MKYDIEKLKITIAESMSIRQVLRKLGIVEAGGNYFTINKKIKEHRIDTSHFTGKGHLKDKRHNWAKTIPLCEILVIDSKYGGGTYKLKNRLLKEGYFEHKCYDCGLMVWKCNQTNDLMVPIPLELEHKNGNRFDNRIENLTLLCPICHALTPTYRRKKSALK